MARTLAARRRDATTERRPGLFPALAARLDCPGLHPCTRYVLFPVLAVFAAACADGGEEDRPRSDVKLAATHHLYSFRSLRGFGTFPVPATAVFTSRGTLNLFDDADYTLATADSTSSPNPYALANDGEFDVYVFGSGREPSVLFRGGYSLVAAPNNSDWFFTDRVSTPNSESVGLYYGTRVVTGQVELEGGWHVLSLHAVFGQSLQSPDNVGRGARGGVTITAGGPGIQRTISGAGSQGTSSVTYGGTIQNLLSGSPLSGDGTCNLTLSYALTGQSADSRVMFAHATNNLVFGLDADESDGEAGMVMMVRRFDTPAAPVDAFRVPGTFLVGGHTLFVNPANSGSDTFVGTVTLTATGGFRLDAVGSDGQDFAYQGSYTLAGDGGLTLTISGTNETWFAAIDRSYNTLVLIDDFVETRSNNTPELNFLIGVRRKTT